MINIGLLKELLECSDDIKIMNILDENNIRHIDWYECKNTLLSLYENRIDNGMSFKEASMLLKDNKKIKRKSWIGYWMYDKYTDKVLMHCKDGNIINMTNTDNILFTISHMGESDWEEATYDNCPLLQPSIDFTEAINQLKLGKSMARTAWSNRHINIHMNNIRVVDTTGATFDTIYELTTEDMEAKDWYIVTQPTYIGFGEALKALEDGKGVAYSNWDKNRFIILKGDKIVFNGSRSEYVPKNIELISDSWIIVGSNK